jgi:HAD superfamily hydrolase (TIGR01509 family)
MNDGGVIFDLDGTLIASEAVYLASWRAAAREVGERITDELYGRLMGFNRADTIQLLGEAWGSTKRAAEFVDLAQHYYERDSGASGHELRAGIRELLDELAGRGVPLAVATSTHRTLAETTLEVTGLSRYFRAVVGGDEVKRGKPHPEIYLAAMARLGISPAQSLAFEDTSVGTDAALAAGLTVVLVPELRSVERAPRERVHLFDNHVEALAALGRIWPPYSRISLSHPSSS